MRLLLFVICASIVISTVNSATAVHPSIFLINPVQPPIDIIRPVHPNIFVEVPIVPTNRGSIADIEEVKLYQQNSSQ